MLRALKWIALIMSFAGLAACASLKKEPSPAPAPPPYDRVGVLSSIETWDLKALIAIRNARDDFTAHCLWHEDRGNYILHLFGPMGSNAIELSGPRGGVLLKTADGKTVKSTSAENLLEKELGFRLPVSGLKYWIRGLPEPGVPSIKTMDASHRLSVLAQEGWRIQYLQYMTVNRLELPEKIQLNNATLNVKIRITDWQLPDKTGQK